MAERSREAESVAAELVSLDGPAVGYRSDPEYGSGPRGNAARTAVIAGTVRYLGITMRGSL
jgi:hypothetical protein